MRACCGSLEDFALHEDIRSPECVMQLYADYNGEWDVRRRKCRWKNLLMLLLR